MIVSVIDNNLDLIQHQEQLLSYQEVREVCRLEMESCFVRES